MSGPPGRGRVIGITRRTLLAALPATTPPRRVAIPAATPISRLDTPWWAERHAAKLADIRRRPVGLLWLGDSITENWEHAGPPDWQDFAPVWTRFYGDRDAINLGFKGDATSHLLWRLQNGELAGMTPKAAIILIGANNLGRAHWPTADNIAGINAVVAETQRRLPATKILLLGILPSDRSAWATKTTAEINAALARQTTPNVTFMDIGSVFEHDGALDHALYYDRLLRPAEPTLHPTAQGMARLAAAIEPTLARLLRDHPHPG